MIVTMVPPKAGRLATGSYTGGATPIKGSVFGNRPRDNSGIVEGGLKMANDRTTTVYASPISDYHNTTTQDVQPARTTFYTELVSVHKAPSIQPHEKGTFFQRKVYPLEDMKFGGSKSDPADTPFHPMPNKKIPQPTPRSAVDGAHVRVPSFSSTQNIWSDQHNSFVQNRPTAANPGRIGAGRWNTVKRGAVS